MLNLGKPVSINEMKQDQFSSTQQHLLVYYLPSAQIVTAAVQYNIRLGLPQCGSKWHIIIYYFQEDSSSISKRTPDLSTIPLIVNCSHGSNNATPECGIAFLTTEASLHAIAS